jgi:hypothetical protein
MDAEFRSSLVFVRVELIESAPSAFQLTFRD